MFIVRTDMYIVFKTAVVNERKHYVSFIQCSLFATIRAQTIQLDMPTSLHNKDEVL